MLEVSLVQGDLLVLMHYVASCTEAGLDLDEDGVIGGQHVEHAQVPNFVRPDAKQMVTQCIVTLIAS